MEKELLVDVKLTIQTSILGRELYCDRVAIWVVPKIVVVDGRF